MNLPDNTDPDTPDTITPTGVDGQEAVVPDSPEQRGASQEAETSNDELVALLELLRKFIGVDFTHYKTATIRRRVLRRMALYKLRAVPDYMDYLHQHPTEAGLLYHDLLINVTSFFRDTDTMDYLGNVLFPRLLTTKPPNQPFRLWIPACSTGEEVYSLAILLLEAMDNLDKAVSIQIFATDLSERVIARARLGRYSASQVAEISPRRLKRFFTEDQDGYCISKVIRDLCVFATHNIFVDPPFSRLDLVSCRNLLIYTDNVLQRKAIATFHYALNPTGHLILGKAETVGSSTMLFTQIAKNFKIYARKNMGLRSVMPLVDLLQQRTTTTPGYLNRLDYTSDQEPVPVSGAYPPVTLPVPEPSTPDYPDEAGEKRDLQSMSMHQKPGQPDDLDQRVNGLLTQYTPPSVVVNKDMEIIRFQGSTSLFLEPAPGRANFNLLKMARPELVFDLRTAINKAHKSGQPASKTGLMIRVREQTYHITINAVPFLSQNHEPLILVIFGEVTPTLQPAISLTQLRNRRIKQLEDELVTLRDDMRSMFEEQEAGREELQSANEEIISSNEELQSINEELETSKEEIQSNNEELQTINQELQLSNDQLSEAYDYSDAIFGTIRETVLVLDKDLRVRTANRAFFKTFRIEPDDTIGRLLYELGNRQWDIPALRSLLDQVINQNTPIQAYEMVHHFQDLGEKVLRLNARKVVRLQGQAAILLAIEDITDHSQVQRLLIFLQSILAHAPVGIQLFKSVRNERNTIVDFQLVPLVNELGQRDKPSVEDLYKTSYKALFSDTEQSALFSRYVQVVETGEAMQAEVLDKLARQPEWHLISANRFEDGFLLVTSTITDRKKAEEAILEREAQLSRLVENTPDVITRWDKNRRLVFANSAFSEKTGLPPNQLLGLTNLEMGQPDEIAIPYMDSIQEVLDTGRPKEHYNVYTQPNGVVFFQSRMVPELGQDGAVEGVLAIARDITQLNEGSMLKQAYETIQQANLDRDRQAKRLQHILDACPTAILTLTPQYTDSEQGDATKLADFRIVTANKTLAQYLEQAETTLPGTLLSQWFTDDSFLNQCRQAYLSGQSHTIVWHDTTNTHDSWLDVSLSRIDDDLLITFSVRPKPA
ncbi:CheR family methyltransferase [Spirosoma linguale]|uniref:MCP methyltransferase, CheR-type with PAS/PAC sensor n=1 Tax=Spirosoma linguale (strain ATCC 33905 / DSM 74 / LMG 10896 / Claus 1) TaxID=504472 RepID=D2QCM9_SPILD|nr:MCP methyltransferase, CheR-type with PAS/PAC sensor [Spirosoma linguale DSM 74]